MAGRKKCSRIWNRKVMYNINSINSYRGMGAERRPQHNVRILKSQNYVRYQQDSTELNAGG